jgi:uncharacterized protein (TIGR00661 family)
MARILYGVMGDARGHVTRALTVAQQMPDDEFLFLGGGRVHDLAAEGYAVEDIPMPATFYRNNQVDIVPTVRNALKVFLGRRKVIRRIGELIDAFDPDLIVTDYEYFTPLAARNKGRPCVSVDHQHILTHCVYDTSTEEAFGRITTNLTVRLLYSNASIFLILSFYSLPAKDAKTTQVLPTIVRKAVMEHHASDGDHVLVYQTSPTFHRLFPVLEQASRRFIIYGFDKLPSRKNLVFRTFSRDAFLQDLASCGYAITNGGHNVISEALYFGKPVMAFPIRNAYEQYLNAHFLEQLGYGVSFRDVPTLPSIAAFEAGLDVFKDNIKRTFVVGNREVAAKLQALIATRGMVL